MKVTNAVVINALLSKNAEVEEPVENAKFKVGDKVRIARGTLHLGEIGTILSEKGSGYVVDLSGKFAMEANDYMLEAVNSNGPVAANADWGTVAMKSGKSMTSAISNLNDAQMWLRMFANDLTPAYVKLAKERLDACTKAINILKEYAY